MGYDDLLDAKIQLGDTVTIIGDANTLGHRCRQNVIVINVPQDVGDLWQFQRPNGSVFAINPYHSSFIGIEKAPRS